MQDARFSQYRTIFLPSPTGILTRFKIAESPVMTPALQAKSPVHTYKVFGIDDPRASGRLDWGPNGFHGYIQGSAGDYTLDPPSIGDRQTVVTYFRRDNFQPRNGWTCQVVGASGTSHQGFGVQTGTTLKTYRLAMKATGEYTAFYGSQAAAQNGVITSVNRCNQVYEIDLAIHMNIVDNTCYTNAATDPYTNNSGGTMLGQNQTTCDASPGNANYDIGHVFSTGGGGVAGLRVVGVTGQKARGVTGSPSPIGDGYDIDYVAHEMGHQYGGNHSFAGTQGNCGGGNMNPSTAYEPGSGSTIMAYAGICGSDDLQPHSDAYFHIISLEEIMSWRDNAGSGGSAVANGNQLPTANAGADFTIPVNTPFKLTGSGTDGNGDTLTYCWEQWDLGQNIAVFRSFNPTTSPTRFCPKLATVLAGTTDIWDPYILSGVTQHWKVTTRDNRAGGGGFAEDIMTLIFSGAQFKVTSPNTNVTWGSGSTQTVTWTVGGSTAANVRILLSTDGGNSYGAGTATVLVASTANDGSESVTLPAVTSTTARIIVEPVGNIYYDISDVNFTINNTAAPTITTISPTNVFVNQGAFLLTVNGTGFVSGTSVIKWNGTNQTTTFVNSTQLTCMVPNAQNQTIGLIPVIVANGAQNSNTVNMQARGIVTPSSYSLITGIPVSGGLSDLQNSDDLRLNTFPNFAGARTDPNVVVEGVFPAPVANPAELQFKAELNATAGPNDLKLQAFNFTNSTWEDMVTTTTSTTDTTVIGVSTSNNSRFISGGQMKMRVWVHAQGGNGSRSWQVQIDRMFIQIHP